MWFEIAIQEESLNNPFAATDPQNHQSENTWFTPKHIIDACGEFGLIHLTEKNFLRLLKSF